METFKIGICEPKDFSSCAIKILQQIGQVYFYDGDDLSRFIEDKDCVFIRLKYLIDDKMISEAKNLKYICSPTTGLNHIQINAENVKVLSLKGEYEFLSTIRATPEHIFGLTLALLRNYSHAFLDLNNLIFDRNLYRGYELYNNSVGIIGCGRIGKILTKYFSAFEANVKYYDVAKKEVAFAESCNSIEELIESTNIVILCVNYTPENEKLIDERYFSLMKNKYFINAARGELVDELALVKFMKKDWFAGVAIDVVSDETKESTFAKEVLKLAEKKNIILTPHIGGATFSSMARTEEYIAKKLVGVVRNS